VCVCCLSSALVLLCDSLPSANSRRNPMCVYAYVCVCLRERETLCEREREGKRVCVRVYVECAGVAVRQVAQR